LEKRNYAYFLRLYEKYIVPIADTFAYCLLGNHFHFMVRIKEEKDLPQDLPGFQNLGLMEGRNKPLFRYFSNFFNAYTKAINKAYSRSGSLFEKNFKRKPVTHDSYIQSLIAYIHYNPQKHGFVDNYRDWPYSSFSALCDEEETFLARAEILSWFDGLDGFVRFHQEMADFREISQLVEADVE